MLLSSFFALLGIVSTTAAAAVHHVRLDNSASNSPPTCATAPIVTTTVTVTDIPPTVTIAVPDPSAISQSLASASSIDSLQISQQTEEAPTANLPVETTATFVHTILAPGFVATEAPNNGTSVYYVSVGHNTTEWNYTPTGNLSVVVGVTTVTVSPVKPTRSPNITITRSDTIVTTATVRPAFTSPDIGWNTTYFGTSVVGGVNTAGTGTGRVTTTTQTEYVSTITRNLTVNVTLPFPNPTPTDYEASGYGSSAAYQSSFGDLNPRQTCVLISAYIGGQWASWCNNWDGSRTLTYTVWETTTTQSDIPGVGPPRTQSSASFAPTSANTTPASAVPTSGAALMPSACGQVGAFEIGFEDLPVVSTTNNDTAEAPYIFNPFEHFYWGDGWTYITSAFSPYLPQNGSYLAEFNVSETNANVGSTDAGLLPNGSFGAGPRNYNDYYWFDADSAWVGCNNSATDSSILCDFVATGYQWDANIKQEKVVVTQHFLQPPCASTEGCHLRQIFFNSEFVALTTLSFYANVQGEIKNFFLDSLELDWFNNTCEAGLARISSRKI